MNPDPGKEIEVDPDPGKEIEVDPDPDLDPERESKLIRIRPNLVDPDPIRNAGAQSIFQQVFR